MNIKPKIQSLFWIVKMIGVYLNVINKSMSDLQYRSFFFSKRQLFSLSINQHLIDLIKSSDHLFSQSVNLNPN